MQALVYLLWITIPVVVLAISVGLKVKEYLLPPEDQERPRKAGLVFTFSLVLLLCALLSIIIEQTIFGLVLSYPFGQRYVDYLRMLLFPVVASIVIGVRNALRRGLKENEMSMMDRASVASGRGLILPILILLGLALMQGYEPLRLFQHDTNQTGPSTGALVRPIGSTNLTRNLGAFGRLLDRARAEFVSVTGVGAGESPSQQEFLDSLGPSPDYNQGGVLEYTPLVMRLAKQDGVDPYLVQAIMEIGSAYNRYWQGDDFLTGLMHIAPEKARAYGAKDVYDPEQNIEAGIRQLKDLLRRYHNDLPTALAAYKVGPEIVDQYGGKVPPFKRPEIFVERVMGVYEILKGQGHS